MASISTSTLEHEDKQYAAFDLQINKAEPFPSNKVFLHLHYMHTTHAMRTYTIISMTADFTRARAHRNILAQRGYTIPFSELHDYLLP